MNGLRKSSKNNVGSLWMILGKIIIFVVNFIRSSVRKCAYLTISRLKTFLLQFKALYIKSMSNIELQNIKDSDRNIQSIVSLLRNTLAISQELKCKVERIERQIKDYKQENQIYKALYIKSMSNIELQNIKDSDRNIQSIVSLLRNTLAISQELKYKVERIERQIKDYKQENQIYKKDILKRINKFFNNFKHSLAVDSNIDRTAKEIDGSTEELVKMDILSVDIWNVIDIIINAKKEIDSVLDTYNEKVENEKPEEMLKSIGGIFFNPETKDETPYRTNLYPFILKQIAINNENSTNIVSLILPIYWKYLSTQEQNIIRKFYKVYTGNKFKLKLPALLVNNTCIQGVLEITD